MDITHVNGQALVDLDLVAFIQHAEGYAYSSNVELRQRSRLYPAVEDVSLNESQRVLYVAPVDGAVASQADAEAFNLLVRRVFAPSLRAATVTGTYNGSTYQNQVWFRGDARPSPGYWEIDVLAANATWESNTESNHAGVGAVVVGGNAYAQPSIEITGGAACTRYRVTVTDNTGQGIGSYMIAVPVTAASSANIIAYHNLFPVPFYFDGTRVYLRVGTRVGQVGTVDIYAGAGVSNQIGTAQALDDGGLTLDSGIASGIFKPAIENPFDHPRAAALSWHPGIVTKHESSRPYTFGWDGSRLRLVDTESSGDKHLFDDDMDAVVLTSPVGLDSITVPSLTLRAGYRPGSGSDADGQEKVMRVIIADIDGAYEAANEPTNPAWHQHTNSRHPDKPYYAQWTFGDNTFPNTQSQNIRRIVSREEKAAPDEDKNLGGTPVYTGEERDPVTYNYRVYEGWEMTVTGLYNRMEWVEDYLPSEFQEVVERFIGCTVTTGAPGVYYLHFPAGSYAGADIPLLNMSINPKNGAFKAANFLAPYEAIYNQDPNIGNASLEPGVIFQADWVDPDTLEPLDDVGSDAITEDPLVGRARVSIWSRSRTSENWTRRWTSSLTGTADAAVMQGGRSGLESALAPGTISLGGDTQVAIGLEPAAANPNHIEWAELDIGGSIEVTTQAGQRPTIGLASVAAQRLTGTLSNAETGEELSLSHVLSDATGLEINTSLVGTERAIRGAGGVGPWYGDIAASGGSRLFDLAPAATNNVSATGNVSGISLTWRDRVAW